MAKFFKPLMELCTPAKVYLFLAAVSILGTLFSGTSLMATAFSIIVSLLWAFLLGYLCDKNMKTLSWVILLLPLILMIAVFVLSGMVAIAAVKEEHKKEEQDKEGMTVMGVNIPTKAEDATELLKKHSPGTVVGKAICKAFPDIDMCTQ